MNHTRIEMNPEIMGGKPVIRGTRVPVELVLRKLGAGMTTDEIIADPPVLQATTFGPRKPLPPTIWPTRRSSIAEALTLRWLADECVDAAVVMERRRLGHDVAYVAEQSSGLADPEVLTKARQEGRLLLTEDKDFGDLVFRSRLAVPGVILLRLAPQDRFLKWNRLNAAIEQFGSGLAGRHIVVEKTRMRSRPLLVVK